jgi:hypothetical protein
MEFRFDGKVLKYAKASAQTASVRGHLLPSDDNKGKTVPVLLWGDSHAAYLAPVFADICKDRGYTMHIRSKAGSPPFFQASVPRDPDLPERNEAVFKLIVEEKIDHVILTSRWEAYHQDENSLVFHGNRDLSVEESYSACLKYTVDRLQQAGCNIWIMSQVPLQKYDPPRILANAQRYHGNSKVNGISISENHDNFLVSNAALSQISKMRGVNILDPTPFFFPQGDYSILATNGLSLYKDEDHVSPIGARMLRPLFDPIFNRLEAGSSNSI